jgi:hypothetical protein
MSKFFTLICGFFLLFASFSCKKAIEKKIEEQQQDLVVLAMTSGSWQMTWFKENGVNINDFVGYEFKYYTNYTVDGIAPSGVAKNGNWAGSSATMTTSCDFPATAGNPLLKINGTWKITKNSWIYVEAEQTVGALTKTMRLDKK